MNSSKYLSRKYWSPKYWMLRPLVSVTLSGWVCVTVVRDGEPCTMLEIAALDNETVVLVVRDSSSGSVSFADASISDKVLPSEWGSAPSLSRAEDCKASASQLFTGSSFPKRSTDWSCSVSSRADKDCAGDDEALLN